MSSSKQKKFCLLLDICEKMFYTYVENEKEYVMKENVLSGIQATGRLTLGNYLGALDNWIKMQESYNCYYMIANLHTLTIRTSPEELRNNTLKILALYLASGLDPEKNTIFVQSQIKEHARACMDS